MDFVGRPTDSLRIFMVLFALALLTACGHNPAAPPPPPDLSMKCPADTQVMSAEGEPTTVNYPAPTIISGTAPYNVTCTPANGSQVPPGTYNVACTASDAAGKTATCGFALRVFVPAKVQYTKYLAFGDSLTEGKTSLVAQSFDFAPDSYTYKLQKLMADRYLAQTITVTNDGLGGEQVAAGTTTSPGGVYRLPGSLGHYQPEVLLLMEGTNDLALGESNIPNAAYALDRMVRDALGRGVAVLLASIPPQKPGSRTEPATFPLIPELNAEIRAVATKNNVPFVDVYAALIDHPELIGSDGLHLTPDGYQVVAQTFFDVIKAKYETRPPSAR